jgi:hypothetical protein
VAGNFSRVLSEHHGGRQQQHGPDKIAFHGSSLFRQRRSRSSLGPLQAPKSGHAGDPGKPRLSFERCHVDYEAVAHVASPDGLVHRYILYMPATARAMSAR